MLASPKERDASVSGPCSIAHASSSLAKDTGDRRHLKRRTSYGDGYVAPKIGKGRNRESIW